MNLSGDFMKKTLCIVVTIFILPRINYCQVDSLKSFFPLQIDNRWQYEVKHVFMFDTTISYIVSTVLKDTIFENQSNSYYEVKVAFSGKPFYDTLKYFRYDSLLKSIIEYNELGGGEGLLFKLDAFENECWDYFGVEVCCGIDTLFVFGENRPCKIFYTHDNTPPAWSYILTDDLGAVRIGDDQSWGFTVYSEYNIEYAKINGEEFGDFVGISYDKTNTVESYFLYQNYPNPFNPATTINYRIPRRSLVLLKVYDILGREVSTIINEEKPAGSYEVEFEGTDLSSGIYFYKLQTENYTYMRKMILMK